MTTAILAQNAEPASPATEEAAAPETEAAASDAAATSQTEETGETGETSAAAEAASPNAAAEVQADPSAEASTSGEATETVAPTPAADTDNQASVEGQTGVPDNDLTKMSDDKGVFLMGVIPVIVLGLFIVLWAVVSYWRQKKNWQELGKDLELSEEPPLTASDHGFVINSKDKSKLPSTQQADDDSNH